MSTGPPQAALAGSVALVTGGGRGVGRVLALALAGPAPGSA
jgi:NAD(P)-dependent dehydrogenase (short-subunit alcohol dehydrogenase family)